MNKNIKNGTFITPYGEKKFYKGPGRTKDTNINNTPEDQNQEKLIKEWIASKPKTQTKVIKFNVKQIITMLERAGMPLEEEQKELLMLRGYKEKKIKQPRTKKENPS